MKADFLSRFKGRTSTMSKEGVTGIVKGSSTPIEKTPQSLSFSSYLARAAEAHFSDFDKPKPFSTDVTPTNHPKSVIYTNMDTPESRQISRHSPLKPGSKMSHSHFAPTPTNHIPLSKTNTIMNMDEFEFVAIPKRLLQYGIAINEGSPITRQGRIISRNHPHKSQSVDNQPPQEILPSYVRQNERKKSFVIAALHSIKQQQSK